MRYICLSVLLLALILGGLLVAGLYIRKRRVRKLIDSLLSEQQEVSNDGYRALVYRFCQHCFCPKLLEYCEYETGGWHQNFGYRFLVTECSYCSRKISRWTFDFGETFEGKREVFLINNNISLTEALALWELKRRSSDRGLGVNDCAESNCREMAIGRFEVQLFRSTGFFGTDETRYLCAEHGWHWRQRLGHEWKMFYYATGKNASDRFDRPKIVLRDEVKETVFSNENGTSNGS